MTADDIKGLIETLDRWIATSRSLGPAHEPTSRRGSANLTTIAAYPLAATATAGATDFEAKVAALRRFAPTVEPGRRDFVSASIDAALAAEVDARLRGGLPPPDLRLGGWLARPGPVVVPAPSRRRADRAGPPESVVRDCATAATLDDVDLVLADATGIARALTSAVSLRRPVTKLLDDLEERAFALCVRPAAPAAGPDDARRTLLHLFVLLRRRRPLAAAVLRTRLRWPRRMRDRDGGRSGDGARARV